MCDPVGEGECVTTFTCESKRGPFVREVETAMRNGWGTALVAATLPDLIRNTIIDAKIGPTVGVSICWTDFYFEIWRSIQSQDIRGRHSVSW